MVLTSLLIMENRSIKILPFSLKEHLLFARNEILEYDEAPGVRPSLSNIGKKLNTIYGYVNRRTLYRPG